MPDSGTLIHLKLPPLSETVRVDAGFVAGDEVSSHYDPMIAKLIVRGETREQALRKMVAALESYEVAGPVTNIEFLKRVCVSPPFVAGEVETGYIEKYRSELFRPLEAPPEALTQAAIGLLLQERNSLQKSASNPFSQSLLSNTFQTRTFYLAQSSTDPAIKSEQTQVTIIEHSRSDFTVSQNGHTYRVSLSPSSTPSNFTTFYPHTRLTTTFINDPETGHITTWQRGQQYKFDIATPTWLDKALGTPEVANSVVAPMPCKVLSVNVKAGDKVVKDQVLAVVESMKMETVIRSPGDAVVKRVVHGAGVSLVIGYWV
jgi:3-methylcrotonyl-CoA carboxylase alpha subunit